MSVKGKTQTGLRCFYGRRTVIFISLLFTITLISSCFVSMSSNVSPFVRGAFDNVVNNETAL
jgi:hypothetical protein